jgi:hypothetical protein
MSRDRQRWAKAGLHLFRGGAGPSIGGQATHQGRSAADRGEHGEAARAAAQAVAGQGERAFEVKKGWAYGGDHKKGKRREVLCLPASLEKSLDPISPPARSTSIVCPEVKRRQPNTASKSQIASECCPKATNSKAASLVPYIVRTATAGAAYICFEEEPGRRSAAKLLNTRRGAADRGQFRQATGPAPQGVEFLQ